MQKYNLTKSSGFTLAEVLVTLGTLAKATEGTNVKAWEVLFLVSSINNEKNVPIA